MLILIASNQSRALTQPIVAHLPNLDLIQFSHMSTKIGIGSSKSVDEVMAVGRAALRGGLPDGPVHGRRVRVRRPSAVARLHGRRTARAAH